MTNWPQLSPPAVSQPAAARPAGDRIAAAVELRRRRLARGSLLAFTQYTMPKYRPEPVHALIAEHLDRVVAGEIKRLMIFAPPQHGKSELAAVRLPAFWLARHPSLPVAVASYAAALARTKSRAVRDVVESEPFARLFPDVSTRDDSRAVDSWQLAGQTGALWAGGVGGPITGHGFGLGIIDDPFKNWQEAYSELIRDRVWDWFRNTFRTRLWENAPIVLINTRWHADDLAGRLLLAQRDDWHVLRLPAVAETQAERDTINVKNGQPAGQPDPLGRQPGEALAPGRYSRPALAALRRDLAALAWHAQYQGAPQRAAGNIAKRQWFQYVDAAPANARRVRYWDKAGTAGGGAYTAGVLLAFVADGVIIENVIRGQWSAGPREAIIKTTADNDAAAFGVGAVSIYVEQEPGSGGKESAETTIGNLAGHNVRADLPRGDKDTRLTPFLAALENGRVWLVRAAWNEDFIDEFLSLPNGTYRDQSDATGAGYNLGTLGGLLAWVDDPAGSVDDYKSPWE